jgi:hypothetical protein
VACSHSQDAGALHVSRVARSAAVWAQPFGRARFGTSVRPLGLTPARAARLPSQPQLTAIASTTLAMTRSAQAPMSATGIQGHHRSGSRSKKAE